MDMSEHSIRDLGTFAEMFAKEGFFKMARLYLNEISERIDAMEKLRSVPGAVAALTDRNPRLDELPIRETGKTLAEVAVEKEAEVAEAVEAVKIAAETQPEPEPEPEPGMIRDENGKVTHVSVKHGELGYDPEIHENTALKILCDGVQVENAHTANTVDGVVKYHKKNERGRIKTLIVHGRVEIKGLD